MIIFNIVLMNTAQAVAKVPGTVPEVQPLQPAPVGVKPDVSHNTNNVTNPSVLPEGVTVQQGQNGQTQIVTAPDQSGIYGVRSGPAGATQWIIVLGIIIVVAIGLLVAWRYRPSNRKVGDATKIQPDQSGDIQ